MINLVVALGLAFLVSAVLIYFISSHDRALKKRQNPSRERSAGDDGVAPEFRVFAKFCTDLCEYLKLEITDISRPHEDELVIRAKSSNPITSVEYLIVGFFADPDLTLDRAKITEISDQIVSERLSKGIVVTPGRFPDDVKNLPELAPMEFLDGAKMAEWRAKIIL